MLIQGAKTKKSNLVEKPWNKREAFEIFRDRDRLRLTHECLIVLKTDFVLVSHFENSGHRKDQGGVLKKKTKIEYCVLQFDLTNTNLLLPGRFQI